MCPLALGGSTLLLQLVTLALIMVWAGPQLRNNWAELGQLRAAQAALRAQNSELEARSTSLSALLDDYGRETDRAKEKLQRLEELRSDLEKTVRRMPAFTSPDGQKWILGSTNPVVMSDGSDRGWITVYREQQP